MDEVSKDKTEEQLIPLYTQLRYDTEILIHREDKTTVQVEKAVQNSGGKIPFSEFMKLNHFGTDGYYASGKVEFGADKDYTTSPETSGIFSRVIAKLLFRTWETMGRPSSFPVIEMGAGSGAMAETVLKWAGQFPEFKSSLHYKILEYGEDLITRQKERLTGRDIEWVKGSAYELPFSNIEGAFISNELVDDFPVERVIRLNGEIKQKYVTIENDHWVELWENPTPEIFDFIESHGIQVIEGIEEPINIEAINWQQKIDLALKRGVAINFDYGRNSEIGIYNRAGVRCYAKKNEDVALLGDLFDMYRFPGGVNITSSVNFKLLEDQSVLDNLEVDYSGLQQDLIKKVGTADILSNLLVRAKLTKSWKEMVQISHDITGFNHLKTRFGKFYVLLVKKGLKENLLPDSVEPTITIKAPKLPVRLVPNGNYVLAFPDLQYEADYESNMVIADSQGQILLHPYTLDKVKILDINGKVVLDLTQANVRNSIISENGYT